MIEFVEAIYDFQPQTSGDLHLQTGQRIEVFNILSNDWAHGKNLSTNQEGVFPRNYVKKVEDAPEKFSRPAAPIPNRCPNKDEGYKCDSKYENPQPFDKSSIYQPPPPDPCYESQPPNYQQAPPPEFRPQPYQEGIYQRCNQHQPYHQYQEYQPNEHQVQQYQPQQYQYQQYQPHYQPQYQPPQHQPPQQYPPMQQYYPEQPVQYQPPQNEPDDSQHHHGIIGNVAKRFGDSVILGAGATFGSDLIHKLF